MLIYLSCMNRPFTTETVFCLTYLFIFFMQVDNITTSLFNKLFFRISVSSYNIHVDFYIQSFNP